MADDFGFTAELAKNPLARVEALKSELEEANTDDVEDIMVIIMDIFKEEVL